MQIAISHLVSKSLKPMDPNFPGTHRFESVPRKQHLKIRNLMKSSPPNTVPNGMGFRAQGLGLRLTTPRQ